MVQGEQLSGLWDRLDLAEKNHVLTQRREAISIFRSIGIWVADSGKHNVLYSRESRAAHEGRLLSRLGTVHKRKHGTWMHPSYAPSLGGLSWQNPSLVDKYFLEPVGPGGRRSSHDE